MDNCKRARLEIINGTLRRGNATQKSFILSQNLDEDIIDMNNSGVTTTTTTTISNAATTTTATALPGNVFLTICDDNSNESQDEFISIENGCIKREPNLTETAQRHIGVNVGLTSINTQTAAALLPATVQLPSGCEIYLVKEYLNPPPLTPTNAPRTVISSTTTTAITAKNNNQIKLENTQINPLVATTTTTTNQVGKSGLQIKRKCNNFHSNVQQRVILNNNNNNNIIDNNTVIGLIDERTDFEKQSELLEAYKKRDDKRRATHNEVERRRRDKINSWIFKLKEMLPNEIPNYVPIESESCNNNSNSNSSTSDQQGLSNNNNNNNNRNCRNLPCDSKSQILIKACEYIKAMQQELKNLRDCLTEQESIRQRNEQLQHELNELKNVHLAVSVMEEDEDDAIVAHCNNHLSVAASDDAVDGHVDDLTHNLNSNPNSNFNVTLNSLNNLGGDSLFMSTTNTGNASLVAVVESKRELLMREFVD